MLPRAERLSRLRRQPPRHRSQPHQRNRPHRPRSQLQPRPALRRRRTGRGACPRPRRFPEPRRPRGTHLRVPVGDIARVEERRRLAGTQIEDVVHGHVGCIRFLRSLVGDRVFEQVRNRLACIIRDTGGGVVILVIVFECGFERKTHVAELQGHRVDGQLDVLAGASVGRCSSPRTSRWWNADLVRSNCPACRRRGPHVFSTWTCPDP